MSGAMLALPLHLILTLVFVYGWGGGVAGAALAAVASRTAQLCYVAGKTAPPSTFPDMKGPFPQQNKPLLWRGGLHLPS